MKKISTFQGTLQLAVIFFLFNNMAFSQMVGGGGESGNSEASPVTHGFSLNFTGKKQDLGTGISAILFNTVSPKKIVFGMGEAFYYKNFKNDEYKLTVTNFSMVLPIYCGYEFTIDKFKIVPSAGIFGAGTLQIYGGSSSGTTFLMDWGYLAEIKLGYTISQNSNTLLFVSAAYYNNFDFMSNNGHFYKSSPISIGVLYKMNRKNAAGKSK
jgi:hypothetical protein